MTICIVFSANPANAQSAGTMRYNSTINNLEFYDGSNWFRFNLIDLGLVDYLLLPSCSNPGALDYNHGLNVYYMCDGTKWRTMLGLPTGLFCGTAGTIDYRDNAFMYCNGLAWMSFKGLMVS
ncbi:hypothetical protein [Micavibrio aeruginosavorus]|uniref:hypothetical protein n=1 Tax=Micavibrio aeruginosavorus TaxID=349221 RepID=UPI003F4AA27C